jgi:hypothetical protein
VRATAGLWSLMPKTMAIWLLAQAVAGLNQRYLLVGAAGFANALQSVTSVHGCSCRCWWLPVR